MNVAFDEAGNNSKRKNDLTISENYAFTGVHHIFDQVILMLKLFTQSSNIFGIAVF